MRFICCRLQVDKKHFVKFGSGRFFYFFFFLAEFNLGCRLTKIFFLSILILSILSIDRAFYGEVWVGLRIHFSWNFRVWVGCDSALLGLCSSRPTAPSARSVIKSLHKKDSLWNASCIIYLQTLKFVLKINLLNFTEIMINTPF